MAKKSSSKSISAKKILAAVIIIAAAFALYQFSQSRSGVVVINKTGSAEVIQETIKRIDISNTGENSMIVSNGGKEAIRLSEIRISINDEPVECRWSVANYIDVGNSAVCEFISASCKKGQLARVSVLGSTEDAVC